MQQHQRESFAWQSGKWLLSLLILTIAGSTGFAQSSAASPSLVVRQVSWSDLFSFLKRPRKPLGGRGNLCLLVPADTAQPEVMWHDRPLFVWQGPQQTIGLRQADSKTVFWRRSLSQPGTNVNQMQYTGVALQPGQTYELLLFSSPTADQPVRSQPFTIMPADDRAPLTTALQALTTKLKQAGASEEAIAQQRAQVFGNRHLEADVLQEAYAVKQPSVTLKQLTTEVAVQICRPSH